MEKKVLYSGDIHDGLVKVEVAFEAGKLNVTLSADSVQGGDLLCEAIPGKIDDVIWGLAKAALLGK